MSKYSVNGTEIIDDNGKIDWSRITSAPIVGGPQSLAASATNCSSYGNISFSVNTATGNVTFSFGTSGGTAFVCDCAYNCNCLCLC